MKRIIVLIGLFILLAGALIVFLNYKSQMISSAPIMQYESGAKYVFDYVPTVVLKGSWKDMGRQYGFLLSTNIRAVYEVVAPYRDKYNPLCGKNNKEIIEELYQSYPEKFKEFFRGMSETSGLTLEQLKATNALEMIMMGGSGIYKGHCSGIAVWGKYSKDGAVIYGRNYDYNPELVALNNNIVVTIFKPNDGSIPMAICTWAGCIYASTGINQTGIYAEENDCSIHDKQAGGMYETNGHMNIKNWVKDDALLLSLLTSVDNIDAADLWMKTHLPIYPHNVGVANKVEARSYQWNIKERIPHAPYVRQADGVMVQTNHYFVIPNGWGLKPFKDEAWHGSTTPSTSIPRLEHLLQLAERYQGKIDVAQMCNIMDVDFDHGGATVNASLFQVVSEPKSLIFKLKTRANRDRWVDIPLAKLFQK